jgi:hypothetical protein
MLFVYIVFPVLLQSCDVVKIAHFTSYGVVYAIFAIKTQDGKLSKVHFTQGFELNSPPIAPIKPALNWIR